MRTVCVSPLSTGPDDAMSRPSGLTATSELGLL
jgi:hypothetical protein